MHPRARFPERFRVPTELAPLWERIERELGPEYLEGRKTYSPGSKRPRIETEHGVFYEEDGQLKLYAYHAGGARIGVVRAKGRIDWYPIERGRNPDVERGSAEERHLSQHLILNGLAVLRNAGYDDEADAIRSACFGVLPEQFLTAQELAEAMSVSEATISRWLKDGMPVEDWGRTKRFRLSDCVAWA